MDFGVDRTAKVDEEQGSSLRREDNSTSPPPPLRSTPVGSKRRAGRLEKIERSAEALRDANPEHLSLQ